MTEELIAEYIECAERCQSVDYGDKKSVQQYNKASDRMRVIVDEVVELGPDAVQQFTSVLDIEAASGWAAHHLVEKTDLAPDFLTRCFGKVEEMMSKAEAESRPADAMGEKMWLQEWKAKRPID